MRLLREKCKKGIKKCFLRMQGTVGTPLALFSIDFKRVILTANRVVQLQPLTGIKFTVSK